MPKFVLGPGPWCYLFTCYLEIYWAVWRTQHSLILSLSAEDVLPGTTELESLEDDMTDKSVVFLAKWLPAYQTLKKWTTRHKKHAHSKAMRKASVVVRKLLEGEIVLNYCIRARLPI